MAINGLLTDIGLTNSQVALNNQGWFIFPTRFELSDVAGTFDKTRVGGRDWAASTIYAVGDLVVPTTPNGFYYVCSVGGASDTGEPTWPTSAGSETDGGVTWDFVGATSGGLEEIWFAADISTRIEAPPNTIEIVLTIPPGADPLDRNIEEIYIFAEDQVGAEFLLAVGQPDATITYDKDGTTSLRLAITLTNVNISGLFVFKYTQATEIAEHSVDPNAHQDIRDLTRLQLNLLGNGDMVVDANPSGFDLSGETWGYGPAEWAGMLQASGAVTGTLTRNESSLIEGSYSLHFSSISLAGGSEELHVRYRLRSERARFLTNREWSASASYVVGEIVVPTASPTLRFRCITAGTTGSVEPIWPSSVQETITDGTVVWEAVLGNASVSFRALQDSGLTQFSVMNFRTPDVQDDFEGATTLLLTTGATDHPMLDDVVTTVERAAMAFGNVDNGLEVELVVDTGVLSSKNFEFSRFKLEPTEVVTPYSAFPFELETLIASPHITELNKYAAIIGVQADVDKGLAQYTIDQLDSTIVVDGDRVLILDGTHTPTGSIAFTELGLTIVGASPDAIIDLSNTYTFTLSGDGCILELKFINLPANGIVLSGNGSRFIGYEELLSEIDISGNSWAITGDGIEGAGYSFQSSGDATFNSVTLNSDVPRVDFYESVGAGLDQKWWSFLANSEVFYGRIYDDAGVNFDTWLQIERSGTGASVQIDSIAFSIVGGTEILTWSGGVLNLISGVSNTDRTIQFASDASLLWDENATDRDAGGAEAFTAGAFVLDKPLIIEPAGGENTILWIKDTDVAPTAISRTMAGLQLSSGGMDASNKYTAGIKFMSTDPQLTTENPKLGAYVIGYATQTYSGDATGGMGIEFGITQNSPGATNVPVVALTIDNDKYATFAGRIIVDDDTETTSELTGSIQTDGGGGFAKSVYVGTAVRFANGDNGVTDFITGSVQSAIYASKVNASTYPFIGSNNNLVYQTRSVGSDTDHVWVGNQTPAIHMILRGNSGALVLGDDQNTPTGLVRGLVLQSTNTDLPTAARANSVSIQAIDLGTGGTTGLKIASEDMDYPDEFIELGKFSRFPNGVYFNTTETAAQSHVIIKSDSSVAYRGGLVFENTTFAAGTAGQFGFKMTSAFTSGSTRKHRMGWVEADDTENFTGNYLQFTNQDLEFIGLAGSSAGPHLSFITSTNIYPTLYFHNFSHDDISLIFDAYYDSGFKSSDAGSNFNIHKEGDTLKFQYDSGVTAGNAVSWNDGISLGNTGSTSFGGIPEHDAFIKIEPPARTSTLDTTYYHLNVEAAGNVTITGTAGTVATVRIKEPKIGTGTVTNAVSLLVVDAPTEGSNNYALWVAAGDSRFSGNILAGGAASPPAGLAGGIAMLNGTAASAALAGGISAWAVDDGAGDSELVVMSEGLTKFHMGGQGDEDVHVGGVLNIQTGAVGNVGAGEDTLFTYTLPAGVLGEDGMGIRVTVWGSSTVSGSKFRQYKIHFGTNSERVAAHGTALSHDWHGEAVILRTGAATQRMVGYGYIDDHVSATSHDVFTGDPTETLSGTVVIKVTGENFTDAVDDVVVCNGFMVELLNY